MMGVRQSTGARLLAVAFDTDSPWRVVIRSFAVLAVIGGLILIGHEIWENISCPAITLASGDMVRAGYCAKIHLAPMLWGITLLSFGLLIIQHGDVSSSLKEAASAGTVIRSWWPGGRRDSDKPVIVEQPVVIEHPEADPKEPPQVG